MKTKEFVNKLKNEGFYAKRCLSWYTGVVDISTRGSVNDPSLVEISETEMGVVKFNGPLTCKDVVDIIMEYANTPVEEREEENRHLVRIKGIVHYKSYLSQSYVTGEYYIDNGTETSSFKTHFTKSEIDKLVEDPKFFLQKDSYNLED